MSTSYYAARDPKRAQRRSMVLLGAIALHILLIWAFNAGLGHALVKFIAPPLETSIIQEEKVVDKPPPPPPPEMEHPPVQVVAPEITINLTPDTPPPPIAQVTTQPVPPVIHTPAPPAPVVPDTAIKPLSIPNPEDLYPSSAKQAGQEGVVRVKLCVDEASKIESVSVAESSGYSLLDDAGVRVAKGGRYRAATKAGKPISMCANLPIRFSLTKK